MLDLNEDVMEYLKYGSSEKVKSVIKEKIHREKVFGSYDVEKLWYKWEAFLDEWKKRRRIETKRQEKESQTD